jgi:serine/threonine protein phosphatase PrpC
VVVRDLDVRRLVNVLQRAMSREPRGSGRAGGLPVVWASTRGTVREENQDRVLIAQAETGLAIAVLSDGMGGMKEGARAATLAASATVAYCIAFPSTPIEKLLADALHFANEEVFRILHGDGGAAVVLAAWTQGSRYVAHAGDARAYHIEGEGQLRQLTIDDTVKGQLQGLGRPSAQESHLHSQLLQFIGMGKELEPHVAHAPNGGRGLLLTSDGVHGLPLPIMEWVLRRAGHLQAVAARLVTASEWNGGHDNGTVVAIGAQSVHEATPSAGVAEFWLPGDHLAVLLDRTGPPANTQPVSPEKSKSQSKKGRGHKQPKQRGPSTTESSPPRERQSPIVEFGEAPPAYTPDTDLPPTPSTPDAGTCGDHPSSAITPNKKGDEQ